MGGLASSGGWFDRDTSSAPAPESAASKESRSAPTPSVDSAYSNAIRDFAKKQQEGDAAYADIKAGNERSRGDIQKLREMRPPAPPEIAKPVVPPEAMKPLDVMQNFGSFATALAVFGGFLTKRPLQTSLDAAASAMEALKQGQYEEYDRNLKTWKTQSEYAGKVAQWQVDVYKNLMDQHKGSVDQLLGAVSAEASANRDTLMLQAARTGDAATLMNALRDRESMVQNYTIHRENLLAQDDRLQQQLKAQTEQHFPGLNTTEGLIRLEKHLSQATPEQKDKLLQVIQMTHPNALMPTTADGAANPVIDNVAQMIATYKIPPMSGYAMKGAYGQAVMSRAKEINPDYDAAVYGERSKAVKDFATGKQGQQITAFNTAIDHLATADELVKALQNHDMQAYNRVANRFKEQFGDTAPTNLAVAKQLIGNEVTKAIISTGGGVTDRQEAQNVLDQAKTEEQMLGATQTIRRLLGGQLRSLRLQYEQTTKLKDFDERLTEGAKGAVQALDEKKTGAKKSDGPPTVTTDEEYAALSPGAEFLDPQGKKRKKP